METNLEQRFDWAKGPVDKIISEALSRGYGIRMVMACTLEIYEVGTEETLVLLHITRECGGDYVK